jgi:hypothetical protein
MNRAFAAGLCALWAATACDVASVQEQASAIPQNQCESDSDCAIGTCGGGAVRTCRSATGTFDTILFEVTPPADSCPKGGACSNSTSIAGFQFLEPVTSVLKTGGSFDLQLDPLATVSGEVITAPGYCIPQFSMNGKTLATASDRSIPVLVTAIPITGALGLFSSPVAAQALIPDQSSWNFQLNVPRGDYDIYIEPQQQPDDTCPVPPQLLRGQSLTGPLNIELAVPQTFQFHVTWPLGDGALDGWSVDMLDSISGRAISNHPALARGAGGKTDYVATLSYLPVVGDTVKVDQYVRLSPPDGVTAPTVLFARSGLGLFSANSGTSTQFTALPTPVHVTGQVTVGTTPAPVAATVMLVATKVTGIDPGVLASFVRSASAGQDGTFALDLLPGTYRVSAVPTASTPPNAVPLAEANTEWVVGTSPSTQAGRVIELSETLPVNGQAVDPSGVIGMTGAEVQAVASPASITTDVLHQALGETTYVPRAMSTSVAPSTNVNDEGAFNLSVDTGTYDFSVRPRASSGFAWLVRPSVAVGTTPVTSNGVAFDKLVLPLPVVYTGTLTIPGIAANSLSPVPGALINSFIYMKAGAYTADPTQADSVLQIGEARSDDTGAFTLQIPAALNAPSE